MIAWLPHSTNPVHAGARIRCLTPLRILRQRGVAVELYNPEHIDGYRVLVVQGLRCRPVPGDPISGDGLLQLVSKLRRQRCVIVVEDCDNHFYNPQELTEWHDIAQRLRQLIGLADHLVASTQAMADVLRRETGTALPVTLVGDGVEAQSELDMGPAWRRALSWRRKADLARLYGLRAGIAASRARGRQQLVWFGAHGSTYADGGMRDVDSIRAVLEQVNERHPLALTIISNGCERYRDQVRTMNIPTRYLNWSRSTFLAALKLHDVAVIPISRTPFTDCKSNNRLLQALNCGLAVCASRIPSYAEFADVCELDNWEAGLESYLRTPARRYLQVARAQQLIQAHWTPEAVAGQWQQLFEALTAPVVQAPRLAAHAPANSATLFDDAGGARWIS